MAEKNDWDVCGRRERSGMWVVERKEWDVCGGENGVGYVWRREECGVGGGEEINHDPPDFSSNNFPHTLMSL